MSSKIEYFPDFNSFNTLMALIEDDREEATNYLSDLSDFFRSILEFREVDLITVRQEVKIIEKIIHPKYNTTMKGMYDIALGKLETGLIFDDTIQPIPISKRKMDNQMDLNAYVSDKISIFVAGWGLTFNKG